MESYIANSQVEDLKDKLVRVIQSLTVQSAEIIFTSPVMVMYTNNPDMVCSIYGISNGTLLFDSFNTSIDALQMSVLPVEVLIAIKTNIENDAKAKAYSR